MNDRRSLIAILVCGLLYAGYMYYLQKRYPDFGKPKAPIAEVQPSPTPSPAANGQTEVSGVASLNSAEKSTVVPAVQAVKVPQGSALENEELKLEFAENAALAHILLKSFKETAQKDAPVMDLAEQPVRLAALSDTQQTTPDELLGFELKNPKQAVVLSRNGSWEKTLELTLTDAFSVDVKATFKNTATESRDLNAGLSLQHQLTVKKTSSGLLPSTDNHKRHLVSGIDGSRTSVVLDDYCGADQTDPAVFKENVNVDFTGVDFHYFLSVMIPEIATQTVRTYKTSVALPGNICHITTAMWQPQGMIKSGESVTSTYKLYLGPKNVDKLAAASSKLHESVDFGWFAIIGRPLLIAVNSIKIYLTHNYGLSIILLTILLKLLFYPFTRAAAVSMKKMQKFTPEINRLKEKYKDDRQAQQRELMQFMSANKINPAKGCLPILPQIPVFIAFYNVLSQSIELRQAPFFGWIRDLSAADPFYVTPILLGAGMVLQQKLTPNPTMDKTQEKIMMIVPFMFSFMMLSLPAGMVLYMLTNTIVSIFQQQWLNRTLKV